MQRPPARIHGLTARDVPGTCQFTRAAEAAGESMYLMILHFVIDRAG